MPARAESAREDVVRAAVQVGEDDAIMDVAVVVIATVVVVAEGIKEVIRRNDSFDLTTLSS